MNAKYYCPCLTLFSETGAPDNSENNRLYDYLIANGIDGLLVLGSAGEFFALDYGEKLQVIRNAVEHVRRRVPLIIGTGCLTAAETVRLSREALAIGADGVMIVGPFYIDLEPRLIESYFDQVIAQIDGPVYLYNYPARTGHDLNLEITAKLLGRHANIAGYKDSVPSITHAVELIDSLSPGYPDFEVFCGYDNNFAGCVLSGGAGAIGALSNVVPHLCSAWTRAFTAEDLREVSRVQRLFNRLMKIYEVASPFIPVLKQILVSRGIISSPYVRSPVSRLSPSQEQQAREMVKLIESLEQSH